MTNAGFPTLVAMCVISVTSHDMFLQEVNKPQVVLYRSCGPYSVKYDTDITTLWVFLQPCKQPPVIMTVNSVPSLVNFRYDRLQEQSTMYCIILNANRTTKIGEAWERGQS